MSDLYDLYRGNEPFDRAPSGAQERPTPKQEASFLLSEYRSAYHTWRTGVTGQDGADRLAAIEHRVIELLAESLAPQPQDDRAALVELLAEAYAAGHWDGSTGGHHFDHEQAKAHFLADIPRDIAGRVRALSTRAEGSERHEGLTAKEWAEKCVYWVDRFDEVRRQRDHATSLLRRAERAEPAGER